MSTITPLSSTARFRALLNMRVVVALVVYAAFTGLGAAWVMLYAGDAFTMSPTVIWPPLGIALAAVTLVGYEALIPITLGMMTLALIRDASLLATVTGIVANLAQASAAAFFLRSLAFNPRLEAVRDVGLIIGIGFFATMIVPTFRVGTTMLYNTLYGTSLPLLWGTWWVGGALSVLTLAPLIFILFSRHPSDWARDLRPWRIVEYASALMALAAVSVVTFGTPYTTLGGVSIVFPLLIILGWIALRGGMTLTSLALLAMTMISFASALFGTYEMPEGGLEQRLLSTQVVDLLLVVVYSIIAALEEQRKEAVERANSYTERLERSLEELKRGEEAKNEFIAILAHELRNPLALLDNSAQLLRFELAGNMEGLSLIERISARVRAMARLLDDLLDVARITHQNFEIKMEVVDLRDVAHRIEESVQSMMKSRKHDFTLSLPDEPLPLVGDVVRLEQILLNLVINAAKYTPPEGRINLSLARAGNTLVVRVADTGMGIPPDMISRVFEPFVQINRPQKLPGVAPSLGVGLSVTKKLVELHGGAIEAASEGAGKGSAFTVWLPGKPQSVAEERVRAKGPTAREIAPLHRRAAADARKSLAILFVDDEEAIADGFKKLLEKTGGHRVTVAYNGKEAIRQAAAARPDVAILDIDLPDMNGYDVARAIRKLPDPPILVAMSGYGQQADKDKASAAGFSEYLVKPAGIGLVTRTLEKLM